ncbi:MAG: SCO family protein [Candidatus Thiodiazotropha sp. 4PDIVS1]
MALLKRHQSKGMWLFCGMLCASIVHSADLPEISTKQNEETLLPPFKMDCITKPSGMSKSSDRFRVSMNMSESAQHDHHAHHRMMMDQKDYKVDRAEYSIPDVVLTSHEGTDASLPQLLNGEKPVMLNFIFTTCTTICPVLSASFHQVQEILGDDQSVSMISITIDPEYDTPAQLMKYSKRFKAKENWKFYTGSYNDVVAVEKAFDIFRGSKMNHEPITLIRGGEDTAWTRIDGLASAEDIVKEYKNIMNTKTQ